MGKSVNTTAMSALFDIGDDDGPTFKATWTRNVAVLEDMKKLWVDGSEPQLCSHLNINIYLNTNIYIHIFIYLYLLYKNINM